MQFLYPGVLWGLFALAIPLIIHLFNFRRTKKVFFTNVAFLKKVETETSSFRRLKQWLIMASRMLFLAALILAFAQPFLPPASALKKSVVAGVNSIYLDNSLSMQNTAENKRYLDLAIIKLDELLSLFRNSQNLQFLTNDFSGEDQFLSNSSKIRDRLTSIIFSNSYRSLEAVNKRQQVLADKINNEASNNFFLFSDFQKSTAGAIEAIKYDSLNKVYIVPVQNKGTHNVFVDSVWMSSPFVREMQNNILYVRLYNSGNEPVTDLPIKLLLDGAQASTSAVSLSENGSGTASFNFTVRQKGQHRGTISFEDQPISFDNNYSFVINASPSIQILHLHQSKSKLDYISKMYYNDSLFVYQSASVFNIDPARISQTDLLVMEGIAAPEGTLVNAVQTFVRGGGSLLIIPPSMADSNDYQKLLAPFGIISFINKRYTGEPVKIDLIEPDKENLFFKDVFERGTAGGPSNVPSVLPAVQWSGSGENLLSLRNGNRFLSRTISGKGQVYILASPLDPEFGNFAEHAFFVPTLFKIAAMSIPAQKLAYNFNEGTIDLPLGNDAANAIYKLKNGNLEILPLQRVMGNRIMLTLPDGEAMAQEQGMDSGFFELLVNDKPRELLAINHASQESKMEFYTPEELREVFKNQPNVTVFDNILDGDFVKTFETNNFGMSLWKYFLYAALLFLLLEILLIRFMKG